MKTAEDAEDAGNFRGFLDINEISGAVVDAAMKVHTALGPSMTVLRWRGLQD
jgi:hypothetical protein